MQSDAQLARRLHSEINGPGRTSLEAGGRDAGWDGGRGGRIGAAAAAGVKGRRRGVRPRAAVRWGGRGGRGGRRGGGDSGLRRLPFAAVRLAAEWRGDALGPKLEAELARAARRLHSEINAGGPGRTSLEAGGRDAGWDGGRGGSIGAAAAAGVKEEGCDAEYVHGPPSGGADAAGAAGGAARVAAATAALPSQRHGSRLSGAGMLLDAELKG